jgi:hypothetical protein
LPNSFDAFSSSHELKSRGISVIVGATDTFSELTQWNRVSRSLCIPFVASKLLGKTGFVFNDFGTNFTITDVDGEPKREVRCFILLF